MTPRKEGRTSCSPRGAEGRQNTHNLPPGTRDPPPTPAPLPVSFPYSQLSLFRGRGNGGSLWERVSQLGSSEARCSPPHLRPLETHPFLSKRRRPGGLLRRSANDRQSHQRRRRGSGLASAERSALADKPPREDRFSSRSAFSLCVLTFLSTLLFLGRLSRVCAIILFSCFSAIFKRRVVSLWSGNVV